MPICILGMHRSGTSMIARMLRDCGVYLGPDADLMPATEYDNPEGYWENLQFVQINDDILKALGGSWEHPPEMKPGWSDLPEIRPFRVRALGVLKALEDKPLWGWKDPRTMLTVEFWQSVIPDLRCLIFFRNPIEVAQSFERRPQSGLEHNAALALWSRYHDVTLQTVDPMQCVVAHQPCLFYDAESELKRILQGLGIDAQDGVVDRAIATVRSELRRNVTSDEALDLIDAPRSVRQHYSGLLRLAGPIAERMEADKAYQLHTLRRTIATMGESADLYRKHVVIVEHGRRDSDRRAQEAETRERQLRADGSAHIVGIRQSIEKRIAHEEEKLRIHFEAFKKHISYLHDDRARMRAHFESHIQGMNEHAKAQAVRIGELEARYAGLDRMLNRLFPPGSFGRRALGKMVRGVRVLKNEGVRGIARRIGGRHKGRSPAVQTQNLSASADDESHPAPLVLHLETDLDRPVEALNGSVALLRGWVFHPNQTIRSLEVVADGVPHDIEHHSLTRFDVLQSMDRYLTSRGNALNSGFWLQLPIKPTVEPKSVGLVAKAVLEDGSIQYATIGELRLTATPQPHASESSTLVAICMTTFNPKPELFRKQVESIRAQTHKDWLCLINDDGSDDASLTSIKSVLGDDPRFCLAVNAERLGFYLNFEAALRRVPKEAAFVALCDQDDEWDAGKLSECIGAMAPGVSLAFSDMRLVDEQGHVLSPTYWVGRRNNYRHLDCLLLGNTITGAASLFRRDLLQVLLPFPDRINQEYHDHWIAVAALACGEVAYLPKALYSYTQHEGQVVGQWKARFHKPWDGIRDLLRWRDQPITARSDPRSAAVGRAMHAWWPQRMAYWSSLLSQRCHPAGSKASVLRRYARIADGLWPAFQTACLASLRGRETLGLQWLSFNGLLAQRVLQRFTIRHRTQVLDALRNQWGLVESKPSPTTSRGLEAAYGNVRFIPKKTAPLTLVVNNSAPKRVNLLTSTIDFRYFFGGYFAVFSLALKMADLGVKVRLVLTDPVNYQPDVWREEIKKYHGLGNFFDRIEVLPNFERQPVEVNHEDQFVATSWWTAFVADAAAKRLGRKRFIYMSQDFEPLFHAANSFYALAMESYALPHYALFSTPHLQAYSRAHGIGVYSEGTEQGDTNSVPFMNAIEAHSPRREKIERSGPKRLLFYARPEEHANRNCFPLGVLALQKAIETGAFKPGEWELHGIGSVDIWGSMDLGGGRQLHLLPKVSLEEYYALVPEYDLGLALMLTPHPSLMPLDMAASGLVTVTNTFDVKTAESLRAISANLVPAEPTVEGISAALLQAVTRVSDLDARVAGTRLQWARNWDEAFNDAVMAKLQTWID